ncbi:MAG: glycine cleavage system aminomethyltransferase GcvT [Verrucomicrobia bacterium]|nr:glycine cleavage system aminomethyltransferase GcvT [Verrucomicrobiota bacterium]
MSESSPMKRSPLHEAHMALGARLVPFAGWEMPVQYKGIVDEHKAVRASVGVFDISHMGQFLVEGRDAETFLNRMLTNNISKLAPGQGQYTLLLNERGGVIDDLIAYRLSEREFFLVVNASMIDVDYAWLQKYIGDTEVRLVDISAQTGGLAIQGPKSREVLRAVLGADAVYPERNTILLSTSGEGVLYLCGTGYTGEEGFEFFAPAETTTAWFEKFVSAAQEQGGMPVGLGARDTLRLEMGYPLNGNDLSPEKTPLEAGLGFFVDFDKGEFIGREVLVKQKSEGVVAKLTGFRMTAPSPPPRAHYPVCINGEVIGETCSGGLSPSLAQGIGMAYLPLAFSKPGCALEIVIRDKRYPAETVKKPFYRKPSH